MKHKTLYSFSFICGLLASSASAFAAISDPNIEVTETMISRSIADTTLIAEVFGADAEAKLLFSSRIDPTLKTFDYSLNPGQYYQGKSISLTTSGAYDTTAGSYGWSTAGSLGSDSWAATGSMTWIGDPEVTVTLTVTIAGREYTLTGIHSFDPTPGGTTSTFSSGTFTGPAGGPGGPGPFGPFNGTDKFKDGHWSWDINVFKNPLVPSGVVHIEGAGFTPSPVGGLGNFDVQIRAVPEPDSVTLLLAGLAMTFMAGTFGKNEPRPKTLRN